MFIISKSKIFLFLLLQSYFSFGAQLESKEGLTPIGTLAVEEYSFQAFLKSYATNYSGFRKQGYSIHFYTPGKKEYQARVIFFINNEESSLFLLGMEIQNKELRGRGLAKSFLKFLFAFAREKDLSLKTQPQTKPRLAFILQKIGFSISKITQKGKKAQVFLDLNDKENFSCYHPQKSHLPHWNFPDSYQVTLLRELPEKCFTLFLEQPLELNEKKHTKALENLPGKIALSL